jgi:hypothetical protein
MLVTLLLSADWTSAAIRGIAVPVAISAGFYFFGRKFPGAQVPANLTREELATPVPGKWSFLCNTLTVVILTGSFFGVAYAARFLNARWALAQGPAVFLLLPMKAWFYLYSGFLGLCVAWPIAASIVQRNMDKKAWTIWMARQNQKAGFDCMRAMRWMAYLIMIPYTAFFLPSLVCHTRFSEKEIATQEYSEWKETRYPYSEVSRFAVAQGGIGRQGQFYPDLRVIIDFKNGARWTTRDGFRDPEAINTDLLNLLTLHTGLKPRYVSTDKELEQEIKAH